MPGLVTHEIYAKKLFSRSVMKCDFLNGNFDAFLLGNQGIDVFNFLEHPFIFDNNLQFTLDNFAYKIQEELYEEFLLGFEELISTYTDVKKKNVAYSFFLGLLANYSFSRNVNPFIFYRTGFANDGSITVLDRNRRMRYETFIDFTLRNHLSYSVKDNRQIDGLAISDERLKLVSEIVYEAFKHSYPSSTIQIKTYADCIKGYRSLIKRTQLAPREIIYSIFLKNTTFGSLIMPKKLYKNEAKDYLNLTHQEWHHPVTFLESNKSFPELFEESLLEFPKWEEIVMDSYKGKNVKKNLLKNIDSTNFYGQKNGKRMMYQKQIFK